MAQTPQVTSKLAPRKEVDWLVEDGYYERSLHGPLPSSYELLLCQCSVLLTLVRTQMHVYQLGCLNSESAGMCDLLAAAVDKERFGQKLDLICFLISSFRESFHCSSACLI